MKSTHGKRPAPSAHSGFTLLELLLVLTLIGILATLVTPALSAARQKAEAVACIGNLRALGIAVQAACNDNDGTVPYIEIDPLEPIYTEEMMRLAGVDQLPKGLLETLSPYGITERHLQCPADIKSVNNYARYKTSYQWRPHIDGENATNPLIYARRGVFSVSNPNRLLIMFDHEAVHPPPFRQNRLYLSGAVNRGTASRR
jgi:prepilin-type N-terminal cleavage/methylation domain-containing protein